MTEMSSRKNDDNIFTPLGNYFVTVYQTLLSTSERASCLIFDLVKINIYNQINGIALCTGQ